MLGLAAPGDLGELLEVRFVCEQIRSLFTLKEDEMKRWIALIGILATLLLSACAPRALEAPAAQPAPAMPEGQRSSANNAFGAPSIGIVPQDSFTASGKAGGGGPQIAVTAAPGSNSPLDETGRLVIQNADLTIVVKDVNARVQAIQAMTKAMGGFLVSVNVYEMSDSEGNPVPQAQMVVRVPQDKLEEALIQVKKDTVDVRSETRSGTDVTDQYVDLQSRLKAKQAAEDQLLKIMQDATKTQDVLDVYAQLQQIQSDIEVLKGQIKYYEQSAAMSALSINILAEATVKPLEVGGWKLQGDVRDAVQSLIDFWRGFVKFMIRFVLYILPVLITIGIPLYLVFLLLRWVLRKTRKPKTVVPVEQAPGK